MELNPEKENNKYSDVRHYQKINIIGDSGVGKTSLIALMENYDDNYEIIPDNLNLYTNQRTESYSYSSSIVEEIKRVTIPINEDKNLFFNLYETNLDNYDFIKLNLDTLLLQTECIIIMWDVSKPDTFDNIPNLIRIINEGIKDNKIRDDPLFLIQNKKDLSLTFDQNIELKDNKDCIEKIKEEENINIIDKNISLLDKNDFYDLIMEINRKMSIYKEKQENTEDVVYLVKFNENTNQSENNKHNNLDNNKGIKLYKLFYLDILLLEKHHFLIIFKLLNPKIIYLQ